MHALLRLVHITAGVFWAGTAVVVAAFLLPAVRAAGPAGGAVMQQLTQVRRQPTFLLWTSWLTLLSGLALYWRASAGFQPSWMQTPQGLAFGLGGLSGGAAALLGMLVNKPTGNRLGILAAQAGAAGGAPAPEAAAEMVRLQQRLTRASRLGAALLIGATVAMGIARAL